MRTVTISNEKGGVGKTMIAYHLAHYLAENGRVLVIDLDQQEAALTDAMQDCVGRVAATDLFAEITTVPPRDDGPLTLVPRTPELAGIERESLREMGATFLASVSASAEPYAYCVIDTPPAFGVRTSAALLVADYVIAPIELDEASIKAVATVVGHVTRVRAAFQQPPLDLAERKPMLVSRFNTHSPQQRALFEDLSQRAGKLLIEGAIVTRDAYARYRSAGVPCWAMRGANGRPSSATQDAAKQMRAVLETIKQGIDR